MIETHAFDDKKDALTCRTTSSFKKEDQIYINYGPFPNHKLLRLYGFALENNPHDSVDLWAPMGPDAPEYAIKIAALANHGIQNDQSFQLRKGRPPMALLGALRIQRYQGPPQHIEQAFHKAVSTESELAILYALIDALRTMLANYATSLAHDHQLIKSCHPTCKKDWILVLRFTEKEILEDNIRMLEEMKDAILTATIKD